MPVYMDSFGAKKGMRWAYKRQNILKEWLVSKLGRCLRLKYGKVLQDNELTKDTILEYNVEKFYINPRKSNIFKASIFASII